MLRLLCLRARRASDGTWRGQVFLSSDKVSEVMARCFALHGTYHGDGVGAVVSTELCVASVQGGLHFLDWKRPETDSGKLGVQQIRTTIEAHGGPCAAVAVSHEMDKKRERGGGHVFCFVLRGCKQQESSNVNKQSMFSSFHFPLVHVCVCVCACVCVLPYCSGHPSSRACCCLWAAVRYPCGTMTQQSPSSRSGTPVSGKPSWPPYVAHTAIFLRARVCVCLHLCLCLSR